MDRKWLGKSVSYMGESAEIGFELLGFEALLFRFGQQSVKTGRKKALFLFCVGYDGSLAGVGNGRRSPHFLFAASWIVT
jgi:hypothetical protein